MRKNEEEQRNRNKEIASKKEKERRKNKEIAIEKEIEKGKNLQDMEFIKKGNENNQIHLPPNVRELPECVRRLYPDSLQFCVPGDGACCLNCLAAWILLDVSMGPQLARDLNTHMAEYREYYKLKLPFPLTITIAGGERMVFDEGEENHFFEMLVASPEASYMWRGSADIIALTNFTQMKIEIAIFNQHTEKVDEVQKYEPDLNFPWKEGDANAPKLNQYLDMKLLNYKNTHFDLIVKRGHPLLGQLHLEKQGEALRKENKDSQGEVKDGLETAKSPIKNSPCAHCGKMFANKTEINSHCKTEHKDEYISMLEKKLKESEENVVNLIQDIEKVKIENKELRTIKKGNSSVSRTYLGDSYDEKDETELDSEKELIKGKHSGFRRDGPQVQSVQLYQCQICQFKLKDQTTLDMHLKRHNDIRNRCKECGETFKTESDLEFHTTYEHRNNSQYNCMSCSFQASSKDQLKTHMNFKHTKEADKEVHDCETCKRKFRSNWHLKNHIRDEHGKDQECTFYKQSQCKFGNTCWKTHNENRGAITFTCYSCKEIFKNMNELMSHRKKKHIDLCKPCEPKTGSCRFEDQPERCWFIHQDFSQALNKQVPP